MIPSLCLLQGYPHICNHSRTPAASLAWDTVGWVLSSGVLLFSDDGVSCEKVRSWDPRTIALQYKGGGEVRNDDSITYSLLTESPMGSVGNRVGGLSLRCGNGRGATTETWQWIGSPASPGFL